MQKGADRQASSPCCVLCEWEVNVRLTLWGSCCDQSLFRVITALLTENICSKAYHRRCRHRHLNCIVCVNYDVSACVYRAGACACAHVSRLKCDFQCRRYHKKAGGPLRSIFFVAADCCWEVLPGAVYITSLQTIKHIMQVFVSAHLTMFGSS